MIAGINYSNGLIIDVKSTTQCTYNQIPSLDKNKVCKNGNYYYQGPGGEVYYVLGTTPVFYLNVCKMLCGGGTQINGQCGEKNPVGYDTCIADLQPQKGCKNSAVPLVQDETGAYYYAQTVDISVPCTI